MPEFRFYATRDESLGMLRALMARGELRAVLAQQTQDAPEPAFFTSLSADLEQELRNEPKVQLHGAFSTSGPRMTPVQSGPDAGRYFLSDASGGPHVLCRLATQSPEGILRQGYLGTQPRYWLTDTESTGPTPALKAAYADMVKQLKQHLVRLQGLFLSPGALQLLKDGQAELPGADKPLGVLIRDAAKLPQLKPVPPSSRKTTRRKVAARTAR